MTTIVTIDMGGTGATHAAGAREALSVPSMTDMGQSYAQANAGYAQANTARDTGNNAYGQANAAYGQANTARSDANTTFSTVNTTFATINTNYQAAYAQANTARDTANNAYNNSNTKLSTSGGSISGDLAITGNLTVQGNATTINVTNLSVNDSMILLSTNAVGDSNDIGFIGHFDRDSTATHAGLIRKATENRFYLFDNYEVEPTNNVIDVAGNNFRVGNLRLGIINANSFVTSAGMDVTGQANAAYAQANAARSDANTTFATINTTFGTINTNATNINSNALNAYASANLAYTQANNARSDANTTFATVNTTFATINTTTATMNTATSNRVLKAGDTMTGQLNISSGGLLVTGNVGVGTAAPSTLFNIYGGTSGNKTDLLAISHPANAGAQPVLRFDTIPVNNNVLGRISVKDAGSYAGDMIFEVAPSRGAANTATTERMVIKGDGSVGIGVTNPDQPLAFADSLGVKIQFNGNNNNGYQIGLASSVNGGDAMMKFTAGETGAGEFGFYNTTNARLFIANGGNVGLGITSPVAGLHINTSTRSLSLASPASGGGGGSYIIMGNNDSGGTAGPSLITAANRALSFGVGDSFSSATGGTMTTIMHITSSGYVGIGNNNPSVNLHITQAVPSGVGSVPSGTGVLLENTGNNYITFRHSADAAKYSGIVFLDNNIGGYVVHGDGGTGDKLYIAGYGGVEIQQGTSSSVTPGARTTIGNFTSSGLTVTGTITETSSIRIKENINPITDALEKVLSMNGYTYDRIDGTAKQRAGLIAEEINEIIPNVVQKDAEGLPYGIQYTNIIAYLVEAIKELKTEINDLKKGV